MTITASEFNHLLTQKLLAANFDVTQQTCEQLAHYLALLKKWNNAYSLTSIDDPERMVTHHILDSLSVTKYLQGPQILDVGTGAGLPGIPLALTHPQYEFTLLDSNNKKTQFLIHIVHALKLTNVKVVQERVELFRPEHCFNTIITRAFSTLKDFYLKSAHLCCNTGQLLALKGTFPKDELAEVENLCHIKNTFTLQIPGLDAERHVVCLAKHSES